MSTTMRCPQCGACWAGVDGMAGGAVVCFDCLSRPKPPFVNRRAIVATALLAVGACVAAVALIRPRDTTPASPPVQEQTRPIEFAAAKPGETVTMPIPRVPDRSELMPQSPTPPKRADNTAPVDGRQEPEHYPVGITLRPQKDRPKEVPLLAEKPILRPNPPTESMLLHTPGRSGPSPGTR